MADVNKVIKDLQGSFDGSNEEQMKGVQLLKGLATSDEAKANEFMKKLDQATSKISKEVLGKKESKTSLTEAGFDSSDFAEASEGYKDAIRFVGGHEQLPFESSIDMDRELESFLNEATELLTETVGYENEPDFWYSVGANFLFSRNGEGVGFWDKPEIFSPYEDEVHSIASNYGPVHSYVDNSTIIVDSKNRRKPNLTEAFAKRKVIESEIEIDDIILEEGDVIYIERVDWKLIKNNLKAEFGISSGIVYSYLQFLETSEEIEDYLSNTDELYTDAMEWWNERQRNR